VCERHEKQLNVFTCGGQNPGKAVERGFPYERKTLDKYQSGEISCLGPFLLRSFLDSMFGTITFFGPKMRNNVVDLGKILLFTCYSYLAKYSQTECFSWLGSFLKIRYFYF
jgi:hypothetical protein